MSWAVDVVGLRRHLCEAASGRLFGAGATGVLQGWLPGTAPAPLQPWDTGPAAPEPDRVLLTAWFDTPARADVLGALRPWLDDQTTLVWREEPEVDWEAHSRAQFPPIQVGDLRIAPPWAAEPGDLIIDPGSGFGTGDHPTTRQALTLFAGLEATPTRAIDIGCGSGILALAAARRGWQVHGTDIDDAALANARHNAALNGLQGTFDRTSADALAPATLVFANLHAELLVAFATQLVRLSQRDLIVAGILADRESAVRDALAALTVRERIRDGEWIAMHLTR